MNETFEAWAEAEVARLRQEARLLNAEANGLEKALGRWRRERGATQAAAKPNGTVHPRRFPRENSQKGKLLSLVLNAGIPGIARDEWARKAQERFGVGADSFRAGLWSLQRDGLVKPEGDRFFASAIPLGFEEPERDQQNSPAEPHSA